jgi:hypothetical protein
VLTFVILFGGLMVVGIVALAFLVRRLDVRGARRATASLRYEPTLEDELEALVAASARRRERADA